MSDAEIPGFELERTLGAGGFGSVWLADQPSVGRKVAVKIGHQPLGDDMARLRFERECQALGRLSGRSDIVGVHVAGTLPDGRPYIVMEYIDGGTLWDRIQHAPLSAAEVATVGGQLCAALSHAHRADILHRDVKPENVFVRRDGSIVLGDFGIAAILDSAATRSGVLAATIPYSAPEVLGGARANVASDVYSVGATLSAAATRSVPFLVETDESLPSLLGRVLQGTPPDIRSHGYPDELAQLVEQLMARDPAARPASATEAGDRLTALAQRLDTHGGTVIAPIVSPSPVGGPTSPPVFTPPTSQSIPVAEPAPLAQPAPAVQPTPAAQPSPAANPVVPAAHAPAANPAAHAPAVGQAGQAANAGPVSPVVPGGPFGPAPATSGASGGTSDSRIGLLLGLGVVAFLLAGLVGAVVLAQANRSSTTGADDTLSLVPDVDASSSSASGSDDPSLSGGSASGPGYSSASGSNDPSLSGGSASGSDSSSGSGSGSSAPSPDVVPNLGPIDTPLTAADVGLPADIEPVQFVLDDDEIGLCGVPIDTSLVVERKEVLLNDFFANDQVGQWAYRLEDEDAAIEFYDDIVESLDCDFWEEETLDTPTQRFTIRSVEIQPRQFFGDDTGAWQSTITFDTGFVATQQAYIVRRFDRVIGLGVTTDEPVKAEQATEFMDLMVDRLGYNS